MMSDRGRQHKMVTQEQTVGSWVLGGFILREKEGISAKRRPARVRMHRSNIFHSINMPSKQNLCLKLFLIS